MHHKSLSINGLHIFSTISSPLRFYSNLFSSFSAEKDLGWFYSFTRTSACPLNLLLSTSALLYALSKAKILNF